MSAGLLSPLPPSMTVSVKNSWTMLMVLCMYHNNSGIYWNPTLSSCLVEDSRAFLKILACYTIIFAERGTYDSV